MNSGKVPMLKKFIFVGKFLIAQSVPLFLLLIFLSIVSSVLGVFVPQIIGEMTNALQGNSIPETFPYCWFSTPVKITVLFVICGCLKIVFSFAANVVDRGFQNLLTQNLKLHLHDKIISLDAKYHAKHDQGENLFNINNATGAASTVSMLFVLPLASLIGLYLAADSLYTSLSEANIPLWLIICIVPALFAQPFVGYWLGNLINTAFSKLRASNMAVNDELLNSFKSPLEIQVMGAEKQRSQTVATALQKVTLASNRANTLAILDNQFSSICVLFFQALTAFVIALYYFDNNSIDNGTAGSLITCILLIPEIFNQIGGFIASYMQAKQSEPEVDAVYDLMMAVPDVKDADDAVEYLPSTQADIELQDLKFGYEPDSKVLDGISIKLPTEKMVAIVSHSGGGKSTTLHLFSRLYDPDFGSIVIGRQDVRKYTLASLRSNVVRISQFPLFIQGSLRDNFRLQKADVTDEEIEKVCRETGIIHLFEQNGGTVGDFQLTLGAENLSGGQRRLLSIARAMLKDPAVLLLDEPTTGVDAQSIQQIILPCLQKLKAHRTVLLVDHNMNFVRSLADMVLVLDKGKVTDFGATETVWSNENSLFRQLWEEYNKNQNQTVSENGGDEPPKQ